MRISGLAILGFFLVVEVYGAPQEILDGVTNLSGNLTAKVESALQEAPPGSSIEEGKKEEHGGIPENALSSKGVGDWYCEEYCYDDGYVYECITDCYEPWDPPPQSEAPGADGVGGARHQDQKVLNRVYNTIDKWRRAKGVPETILPTGLEPIVHKGGHIWKHSQHASVEKKANAWGKKYGLYYCGAIIACASRGGCLEKYSNFDLRNPAQTWYDFKDRTGHYKAAINPKNKYIACSADKQWQSREDVYGWSIWCLFMCE